MKKLGKLPIFLLLILVLVASVLEGCSSDPRKDAAGTYKGEYVKRVGQDADQASREDFTLKLKSDGTGMLSRGGAENPVTWTLEGEEFAMRETAPEGERDYTGTLEGGRLDLFRGDPADPDTEELVCSVSGGSFKKILLTVFSVGTLQMMLRSATPVALAAIGGSMTEHAGIMNIGMEGMILMGAFFGVLGSAIAQTALAGVGLAILLGVLVGLFFALLVVRYKSDEFIIGCALNTFALGLTSYLSRSYFGASGAKGQPGLPVLHLDFLNKIPILGPMLNDQSLFIYLTWLIVLLAWLFVYKTPYGFWLRASGEKPDTLRTAGISPKKMKWIASILCGVLCALAGAHLSLGHLQGTFAENMSNNRGFIAFACVIFAAANPAKAYLAALMFGFFEAIGLRLQGYVSSDLTNIIPYVITVIMMVYVVVRKTMRKRRAGRLGES